MKRRSITSTFGVVLIIIFAVAGLVWFNQMPDESGPRIPVTVDMFSGRPSPYFNGASLKTIEEKIKDLPPLEETLKDGFGLDTYSLNLPTGEWVVVCTNGIRVSKDRSSSTFRDARGLREYLDKVRERNGLLDGMTNKKFDG